MVRRRGIKKEVNAPSNARSAPDGKVDGKETVMDGTRKSLRAVADKWLALLPDATVHVTRLAHGQKWHRQCVYVRVACTSGEVGMFFFRHDDGAWYIFPPREVRPEFGTRLMAA